MPMTLLVKEPERSKAYAEVRVGHARRILPGSGLNESQRSRYGQRIVPSAVGSFSSSPTDYAEARFRGRPPFAPLWRAAAVFAFER
jgi:hypothetical protein